MAGGLLNADGTATALTRAVLAVAVVFAFAAAFALRSIRVADVDRAGAAATARPPAADDVLEAAEAAPDALATFAWSRAAGLPALHPDRSPPTPPKADIDATLVDVPAPTPELSATPAPPVVPPPPAPAATGPFPAPPAPKPPPETFDSVG